MQNGELRAEFVGFTSTLSSSPPTSKELMSYPSPSPLTTAAHDTRSAGTASAMITVQFLALEVQHPLLAGASEGSIPEFAGALPQVQSSVRSAGGRFAGRRRADGSGSTRTSAGG